MVSDDVDDSRYKPDVRWQVTTFLIVQTYARMAVIPGVKQVLTEVLQLSFFDLPLCTPWLLPRNCMTSATATTAHHCSISIIHKTNFTLLTMSSPSTKHFTRNPISARLLT